MDVVVPFLSNLRFEAGTFHKMLISGVEIN